MQLVKGDIGAGATEGDAGALHGENGVVEIGLGLSEFRGDGEGARYVGDVVAVFLECGRDVRHEQEDL